MFSGIVQGQAEVHHVEENSGGLRFQVLFPKRALEGIQLGASVSIDGVCLTLVVREGALGTFDVIGETLFRSTLGNLKPGCWVNFERSLKFGDEIGGHMVSGHVFGTGKLARREAKGETQSLLVNCPKGWMRSIFLKGFIAVNGVSLTVGELDPAGGFWLHLIPETLSRTNLSQLKEGDAVNIELDSQTQAIVETVEKILPELIKRRVENEGIS